MLPPIIKITPNSPTVCANPKQACLGFAHTVGEFGVILMIGGNIPGETRVLSIALFDHVEAFDYARAHLLSIGLLIGSLVLLAAIYWLNLISSQPSSRRWLATD